MTAFVPRDEARWNAEVASAGASGTSVLTARKESPTTAT
jgi:hypothetical protein